VATWTQPDAANAYELPRWTKTDILHTTTGIPYFRILLLQEAVAKIKRWRHLVGSRSPLTEMEKTLLQQRLASSTVVTKVTSYLGTRNPLLETTDWVEVTKALAEKIAEHWREIKKKTLGVRNYERGG